MASDVARLRIVVGASTSSALRQLTILDSRIRSLGDSSSQTSRDTDRMHTSMQRTATSMDRLRESVDRAATSQRSFGNSVGGNNSRMKRMTTLVAAATVGIAALGPVTVGALGALGGLASMFSIAGLGAGAFGLAVYSTLKNTKQGKEAVKSLSKAFKQFGKDTAKYTMGPIKTTISGMVKGLKNLVPMVAAVAPVAQRAADAFKNWSSKRLTDWVPVLEKYGVPILNNLVTMSRSLAGTFGQLVLAFAPFASAISLFLSQQAGDMEEWAKNGGFKRFLDKVEQNGPMIKDFFTALGRAVSQLTKAMAGLGPLSLSFVTNILKLVANTPVPVLQGMIIAFLAYKTLMIANTIYTALFSTTLAILGGRTIAATVAQWALNAAMLASPITWIVLGIIALVAVIVLIATKTTWFQTAWTYTWNAIKTAFSATWNFIKGLAATIWSFLGSKWGWLIALLGPIGWLIAIAAHWSQVWNFVKMIFSTVVNAIVAAAKWLWKGITWVFNTIRNGVVTAWQATWGWVKMVASTVWRWLVTSVRWLWNGIKAAFNAIRSAVATAWSATWNWVKSVASAVWHWIVNSVRWLWNMIKGAFNAIRSSVATAWGALWGWVRSVASSIWHWLVNSARWLWAMIKAIFTAMRAGIARTWSVLWNWVKGVASRVWNWLVTSAKWLWNWLKSIFNGIKSAITGVWDRLWRGVKKTFNWIWGWLTWAVKKLGSGLKSAFETARDGIKKAWDKLKGYLKKPISFVVNTVFNKGLVPVWNNTAAKLPGIGKMKKMKEFATGGYTGGGGKYQPKGVVHGGEYVINKKSTRKMGHGALAHINRTGALPGHAVGGLVGDTIGKIGSGAKKVGGAIVGGAKSFGGNLMKGLGKLSGMDWASGVVRDGAAKMFKGAWNTIVGPMRNAIPDAKNNKMVGGLKKAIDDWRDKIAELIAGHEESAMGGGVGGNGFVPWAKWKSGDGKRVSYRGAQMNVRTKKMLQHAEKLFGHAYRVMQGSYSNSVGASAGTHSGGGALDLAQNNHKAVASLRASGFAAWARGKGHGSPQFGQHTHAIAVGDPTASGAAKNQVKAFMKGKNGLANNGPDNFKSGKGSVLGNARVIAGVAKAMGMGKKGALIGLMTALQESGLRNLSGGDRDSLGLFQQRPSMGWGSKKQIMNPNYSASKFFSALKKVKGWRNMRETVAAQKVQRSAFPNAYQKHKGKAKALLSKVWANGGYTGAGNRMDPAGIVHAGEFVVNRRATSKLGLKNLNWMNNTGTLPGGESGPTPAATGGGTDSNINIYINIGGSFYGDEQELVKVVRTAVYDIDKQNRGPWNK